MERSDIIEFFDRLAPDWDAEMIRDDQIVNAILDRAEVSAGKRVLDVACGTGVLFPDYLARGVHCVVGVDLSPRMAEIAAAKLTDPRIRVICADVQELNFEQSGEKFDCVVVYNAFPHFPDPARLIRHLASCLAPGGRLTVAHGMCRAKIDAHHCGTASKVSRGLISEDDLKVLMEPWFDVDVLISDEQKYIVSGVLMCNHPAVSCRGGNDDA